VISFFKSLGPQGIINRNFKHTDNQEQIRSSLPSEQLISWPKKLSPLIKQKSVSNSLKLVSCVTEIQAKPPNNVYSRYILILSSHMCYTFQEVSTIHGFHPNYFMHLSSLTSMLHFILWFGHFINIWWRV
jgi:hypothetical protein